MVKILFFWKASTLKPPEAISGIIKHYIVLMFSLVWVFVTPWTVAHHSPLFMGFFMQEYWNGLLLPPPGSIPDPGIEPVSSSLQVDSLPNELSGKPSNTK